uniref:Uncharacterized protein n=1 Tax=Sphaerodactylus townsendi TaxID=933632 RepID=A0ACB8ERM4_9SAUR
MLGNSSFDLVLLVPEQPHSLFCHQLQPLPVKATLHHCRLFGDMDSNMVVELSSDSEADNRPEGFPILEGENTSHLGAEAHRGSKRSADSSSSSEYSSDEDSAQADRYYWFSRDGVPVLPPVLAKCRDLSLGLLHDGTNHDTILPGGELLQDPPGWHLPKKVRDRALDGYYVDIFEFVMPDGAQGVTGKTK